MHKLQLVSQYHLQFIDQVSHEKIQSLTVYQLFDMV